MSRGGRNSTGPEVAVIDSLDDEEDELSDQEMS